MRIRIIEIDSKPSYNFKFRTYSPENGHLFVRFKSKCEVLTKDGYKSARPGDFIFYNQNDIIEYNADGEPFIHDYIRFYLDENENNIFTLPTSMLFDFPLSDKLENILKLINSEYYSVYDMREEALNLLGKFFLIASHEYIKDNPSHSQYRYFSMLSKLRMEMLNNLQNTQSIAEIAAKATMSPSYFQKIYKKTFGISCINDLINARINKAKYLLSFTDKKETEIAELCGYNNVEHFIRQFKKFTGTTPSGFKKQI